jgi:predicted glycosyltransferase
MKKLIWIDFENAPHVWVLKEFIGQLKNDGIDIIITARNFSSTIQLCEYLKIPFIEISAKKIYKKKYGKLLSTIYRAFLLMKCIKSKKLKPNLAISHGSRSQGLAAYLLKIPVISLDDYEYSSKLFNIFVKHLLTPQVIPSKEWGIFSKKIIHYPGLKEELYLWNKNNYTNESIDFFKQDTINIIFRPEGRHTHYSSEKSRMLQNELLDYLVNAKNIFVVLLARDKIQEKEIEDIFIKHNINYLIPKSAINGLALIYHADLVIGGGGTMTREAAILNVPSYTFFGGKLGHVDKYLIRKNKLKLISSTTDINKIKLIKNRKKEIDVDKSGFNFVYNFIKDNYLR